MKKITKLLTVILVLGMMMGIFAALGIPAAAAPATTTVDGATYYEIGSAEDLVWFANEVNENDKYKINARLTANIDLSSVCSETLGSWTPISGYQGIFDGAGFEISGLYCTGQEKGGLFGMLYDANAVVKNVTVRGYVSGTGYVGGIVGYLYSSGAKIINCVNYATISVSNTTYTNDILVGGIVGYLSGEESLVEDCINYGNVTAIPIDSSSEVSAGGIAGQSSTGSTIRNCANYGDISDGDATSTGWIRFGGIVGFTRGNVIDCYNDGDLQQYGIKNSQELGGIAGSAYDSAKIENCFNNGSLSSNADANLGAVTGELFGTINNTYWNTEKTSLGASGYNSTKAKVNNTSGLSAAELATGVVAYNMGDAWGQKLGTDSYPVLGGMKVYRNVESTSFCSNPVYYYANVEDTTVNHDTTLGAESFTDGVCNNCGYVCTHPNATFTYSNVTNTSHDATYNCCNKFLSGEAHSFDTAGVCSCGETADASLTNGSAVTYYATLEEAIAAACGATNSTVTLLDNCSPVLVSWITVSGGKFTIDLNGKQITVANSTYPAIIVESGNITLKDSVGGGGSNGGAHVRGDGTLRVEGGTYGGTVSTENGNLIIVDGSFAVVSLDYHATPGTISLMGGDIAKLQVRAQSGGKKMADVIVRDYYLADENGVLIDPNDAQLSDTYFYYLENVTVQRGADLSGNAVVTVENAIYNGSSQTPVVTVTVMGTKLMMGVDFSFTYPEGYDITNAGTTELTIKAIGSYYTGETTATYTIEKATLTEGSFTFDNLNPTFNFDPHSVSVSLPTGLDPQYVTVGYMKDGSPLEGAPEDAGEYKVVVSVVGSPNHYDALFTYDMTISPAPVEVEIAEIGAEFFYNGYAHKPKVVVTLNNGLPFIPTDFGGTVSYENNYDVGTATVTVGGNYTGSCTFVIQKGNPTITAKAPVDKVMPGYRMTLTGVTDAFDNSFFPTEFSILPGEGYTFDGMTITINDGVVYDSTIVVNIASTETKNYNAAVGTLTLTVGIPVADTSEFNNKITGLDNAVKELEEKYGADLTELDKAIEDLKAQVNALDEDGYTTDTELADAIVKVDEAITELDTRIQNLENTYATKDALTAAKAELNTAIALKADTATLNAKVAELNTAIANAEKVAKAYADTQDVALKSALEEAIATAKAEAIKAADDALTAAKAELNEVIALKADTATLNAKVAELNTAIANAEKVAKAYADTQDVALKSALEEAIATAKAEAIKAADDALTAAKAELNAAISLKADTATLNAKVAELNTAIANAEKVAKEYADSKDAALKSALEEAIATAKAEAIKAADDALTAAKAELNTAIALKADTATLNAKVAELNTAIANAEKVAKAYADTQDVALKSALEEAIATAKAEAIKAADDALTAAKAELNEAIALKADTATLNAKVAELNTAIANAEKVAKAYADTQDVALKSALEEAIATAKAEAIKAADDALTAAKAELNAAIALKADTATLNAKVAELNAAIANAEKVAKAYADTQDVALKSALEEAIATAKAEAIKAADDALTAAKAELNEVIALKADTATLNAKVAELNAAIANAEKAAKDYADANDDALKATLINAIKDANDAVTKYNEKLIAAAKDELNKAIAEGDKTLDDKIAALNTALENAKAALEATDAANQTELIKAIADGEAVLQAAINKVASDLAAAEKALKEKDAQLDETIDGLNTVIIIVGVVAGVGVAGNVALLTWMLVSRRKPIPEAPKEESDEESK